MSYTDRDEMIERRNNYYSEEYAREEEP